MDETLHGAASLALFTAEFGAEDEQADIRRYAGIGLRHLTPVAITSAQKIGGWARWMPSQFKLQPLPSLTGTLSVCRQPPAPRALFRNR